jgi:hypothetical protein
VTEKSSIVKLDLKDGEYLEHKSQIITGMQPALTEERSACDEGVSPRIDPAGKNGSTADPIGLPFGKAT